VSCPIPGLAKAGRKVTVRDYKDTVNEVRKEHGKIFSYEVSSQINLSVVAAAPLVTLGQTFLVLAQIIADSESNAEKTEARGVWKGQSAVRSPFHVARPSPDLAFGAQECKTTAECKKA
jgi:hypothetical protein